MLAERDPVACARSREFWRELCPELSITESPFSAARADYEVGNDIVASAAVQIRTEGYFRTGPIVSRDDTIRLANAVSAIVSRGFPATFVLVYDDLWQMLLRVRKLVGALLGGHGFCMTRDVWVYYVRAASESRSQVKEDQGWGPHRDGSSTITTLRGDGTPQLIGVWIPFTDATVEQSCIYVLPANRDPNYPDMLAATGLPLSALQGIRALPVQAGAVLGWNEYTLHWGSCPTGTSDVPRISVAARYQTRDIPSFDTSYLEVDSPLDFTDRLGIVGTLVRRYRSRTNCPEALAKFCEEQSLLYEAVEQFRRARVTRAHS
jgi:hypothetical protein